MNNNDYDNLEEIEAGFFDATVKSVVLPKNLKAIPKYMFSGCTELEEVVINDKVTKIGGEAFARCRKLKSITIPASVTELDFSGYDPFIESCLEEIIVDENNPKYKSVDGVLFTKDGKKLLAYPCRKPGETYTIPEGVEEVESDAFFHYMDEDPLKEVIVPETVHLKSKRFMNNIYDSSSYLREWYDGYYFHRSGWLIDNEELFIIAKYYDGMSEDEYFDDTQYIGSLNELSSFDLAGVFERVKEKADQGDKKACLDLARLYIKGHFVEKNEQEAKRYFNIYKSAE